MIFEALQSLLVRFHFYLLRSKFQKIPEFNLTILGSTLSPIWMLKKFWRLSWPNLGPKWILIRTLELTIFSKNAPGHTRDEQMFRCSLKFILYIFLSILVFSYRQGIHEHRTEFFKPVLKLGQAGSWMMRVVDSWFREQFISLWIIPTEQSNGPAEYFIDDVTIDPFLFSFEENDREFTYSGFCGYGSTREELLVLGTDPRTGSM